MRLVSYARQSKSDRNRVPSTEWQHAAMVEWAAERGHEVVASLADVDTSGYRRVARPGFDDLLALVRDGDVDGTLVWRLDRLSRQGQWGPDVLRFMEARAERDTALLSVLEDVDTTSAAGELILGVRLSMARGESEAISARWRAQKARAAEAGAPLSGGHRWFGWSADRSELVPVEAAALRDAAEHVLAGGSLRALVLAWNAAGLRTSTGRTWSSAALRGMLASPRLAGVRMHHGERVGSGSWPAVVDEATSERLVRLLSSRRRGPGAPPRSLLGGLLVCHCGARMRSGPSSQGRRRYGCPPRPDGCNGCTIVQEDTDREVSGRFLARLRDLTSRPREADDGTAALEAALSEVDARLAEAATDYYGARLITRGQFEAVSAELGGKADRLRRELGAVERRRVSEPRSVLARWDEPGFDRRAALEQYVDRVEVSRATRGNRWDPDRVRVAWVE